MTAPSRRLRYPTTRYPPPRDVARLTSKHRLPASIRAAALAGVALERPHAWLIHSTPLARNRFELIIGVEGTWRTKNVFGGPVHVLGTVGLVVQGDGEVIGEPTVHVPKPA